MATKIYAIDPLQDLRWDDFVGHQPSASIFHSTPWLRALQLTYNYEPVAFTTSAPGDSLKNALVFCRIKSWLTGDRLVSLPFSDHSDLLAESAKEIEAIVRFLCDKVGDKSWRYVELRPVDSLRMAAQPLRFDQVGEYCLHMLDLRPSLDEVFRSLHKDSAQRRIRHAERAGLRYECGNNETLLKQFFDLFVTTRRHHGLPPQPYAWFAILAKCMGEKLKVFVAYQGNRAIAAVLTLKSNDTAYYKYGASDLEFNKLGATPFLFWKMIEDAKNAGARSLDLGRSDLSNTGLIAFKDHWTSKRVPLFYWRFPAPRKTQARVAGELKFVKGVFARMPRSLLIATGNLVYRHIG